MKWIFWQRRSAGTAEKQVTRIQLRTLHGGITLDVWRASEVRTRWAADTFDSRIGRDLLAVLRNEMPTPVLVKANGEADYDRSALGGAMVAGYKLCLDTLLLLAHPPERPPELPEADYSAQGGPQIVEDE